MHRCRKDGQQLKAFMCSTARESALSSRMNMYYKVPTYHNFIIFHKFWDFVAVNNYRLLLGAAVLVCFH